MLDLTRKGNLEGANLTEAESAVMVTRGWGDRGKGGRERVTSVQHYCSILPPGVLWHNRVP